jgi:alginate O-acetyltransferase complex protein AlgI
MTIIQIAVLTVLAILIGQLRRGRGLVMLGTSALVVFWLQPTASIGTIQFWLPFATLGVGVLAWVLTTEPEARGLRQNWPAIAVLAGTIIVADLSRYLSLQALYATPTPALPIVMVALVILAGLSFLISAMRQLRAFWLWAALVGLIAVFIVLKTPSLASAAQSLLASLSRSSAPQAGGALSWLGYSYFAFRLMHTIRDRQTGRLPSVSLSEYMNYVIFFPAFTAGPIDRLERFNRDYCAAMPLSNEDRIDAGTRLFVGLFKKFVVADLLAVISINDTVAKLAKSPPWLWLFLYAYAFRIYFDFSGYTDIAIGMGKVMGIRLPENFASPYLKPNLTQFWNSWHMTLTQWFRSYVFNPLARSMRSMERPLPTWLVILAAQMITMVLIGLWHGVTWGFIAWGAWHAFGLFVHNRWSEWTRGRMPLWTQAGRGKSAMSALGVFATFNYVALGWLFFTLSSPAVAWQTILRMFGVA